jgi:type I restriction enzyme M protein
MYYHLKDSGCCAIVEFPGVLYRGGAEKKIREYLLNENAIDAIIQMPANLFFGVSIATCIIVLKKQGRRAGDDKVLFIDASHEFVKDGNSNYLSEENQQNIFNYYKNREDKQYISKLVSTADIIANECSLNVSSYVEQEDTREKIKIEEVNERLRTVVSESNALREQIEKILAL